MNPDRSTLTALYLGEAARHGVRPEELTGLLTRMPMIDAFWRGRYLPRPLFLGAAERDRLHADVENLRAVLTSLPDRLFDGDLAAFGRAVGATDRQIAAVLRGGPGQVTSQTRADLYLDESGFKLLEVNHGSPAAGIDTPDFCRAMLAHPVLARFAAEHRLGFPDTMRAHVATILAETGFAAGSQPVLAIATASSMYQRLGPYLDLLAPRWRELGLDAVACDVADLRASGGRVWLNGRAVDIVFRLFMIEHVPETSAGTPFDPVLEAAARGEVQIYTSLDGELLASKMALAMLSDDRNRHLFAPAELAAIDRIVPWTRAVRPGPVTLPDGSAGELMDYAVSHADDLVLKPAMLHGGEGVLVGWQPGLTEREWRDRITAAAGRPFVLQRRVRPVPEPMHRDDGELVPWDVAWGVCTLLGEHGGILTRGLPHTPDVNVINFALGAVGGSALTVQD
ncbi:MAG TPA: hypothetical protein VGI74_04290 [Streptosporangiaceae bacterium]